MAADDVLNRIGLGGLGAAAGESKSARVSRHQAVARAAVRGPNGRFLSEGKGQGRRERQRADGPKPGTVPRRKSRVGNGHALFLNGNATTAEARRFADIFAQVISDLGGRDAPLSEGQRQLARRAVSLSLACEKLEASICSNVSAAEASFLSAAGGLSPYVVLRESSRVLHAVARARRAATRSPLLRSYRRKNSTASRICFAKRAI
jgi:hypothetical protein